MTRKLPIEPVAGVQYPKNTNDAPTQLSDSEDQQAEDAPAAEIYPGTGEFINARGSRSVSKPAKGQYTLNFDDADLGEVAKVILGETLDANYVLSPRVAGKVTLQTTRALTREELIPTLEMLLRMNGAVLIRGDGLFRIEPAAQALTGMNTPRVARLGQHIPDGFQLRIVPLRYIGVQEMQKILTPLLPPKGIIRADVARNLLMIAGTANELGRILETVSIFDVDWMKGMSVGLYTLQNVEVGTVITELDKLFGEGSDGPLAGMFKLLPIERLNAIMVVTQQPKYLEEARVWVDRLDRSAGEATASGSVHVYRVQNVDAEELASTMSEIFSGKKKSTTPKSSLAPGLKPGKAAGKKNTRKKKKTARNGNKNLGISDVGDVRIIADVANNSLVVVSTAREYEVIQSVLKQLDVVPLQVLIDATIVEITLSDRLEYGLKWFLAHGNATGTTGETVPNSLGQDSGQGGLGNLTLSNVADLALNSTTGGFSYGFLDSSDSIGAVLSALADESLLNVVSAPSLMVLNNQEASIQVGDQIPIQTSNNVTTGGVAVNSFQRQDTGVKLKVKPRVNAGGMVIMEVEQNVDDAVGGTTGLPIITKREIKSSIAVQSGDTIILGGLIEDTRRNGRTGLPILSRLPLIGPLFGNTSRTQDRTELVVLLTPRVVQNRHEAVGITNEFKRKLSGLFAEAAETDKALEMKAPEAVMDLR